MPWAMPWASRPASRALALLLFPFILIWSLNAGLVLAAPVARPIGIIPATVTVEGPQLRVTELSRLQHVPTGLLACLHERSLGPAPSAGQSIVLTRDSLLLRVRSACPEARGVQWQVASSVTISRAFQLVERADVRAALEAFLQASADGRVNRTLTSFALATPLKVPKGPLELRFEAGTADDLLGSTPLILHVHVGGNPVARVPMRAEVSGVARGAVAARALRAGETLGLSDVQEAELGVRSLAEVPLPVAEAVGQVTRRTLSAGTRLGSSDLMAKALVLKGDSILITVRTGGMVVSCQGVARQDGRKGELITVLNTNSQRELRARVVEEGLVQVDYRPPPRIF